MSKSECFFSSVDPPLVFIRSTTDFLLIPLLDLSVVHSLCLALYDLVLNCSAISMFAHRFFVETKPSCREIKNSNFLQI